MRARPARLLPLLAAVLVPLLLAGCAELPPSEEGRDPLATGGGWRLGGRFTEAATQQDMEQARGVVAARGGEMRLMESFPVQFAATGLTDVGCQKAREELADLSFVASVTACAPA